MPFSVDGLDAGLERDETRGVVDGWIGVKVKSAAVGFEVLEEGLGVVESVAFVVVVLYDAVAVDVGETDEVVDGDDLVGVLLVKVGEEDDGVVCDEFGAGVAEDFVEDEDLVAEDDGVTLGRVGRCKDGAIRVGLVVEAVVKIVVVVVGLDDGEVYAGVVLRAGVEAGNGEPADVVGVTREHFGGEGEGGRRERRGGFCDCLRQRRMTGERFRMTDWFG